MKLGPAAETRMTPEDHEQWQDSVVLCWWDLEAGIGGFHRIGHQPLHPDGPTAHLSSAFFTSDRVFKRNESLPLRSEDQPDSGYPKSGQLAEQLVTGHLEAGGSVQGRLTFAGKAYEIDGLAFRDRGWGKRDWETPPTGARGAHRGRHVHMVLTDGDVIEMDAEPLQKGAVSWMAGKAALCDTISKITWGDRVGICCYEMSNNAAAGRTEPVFAINGILENGMHRP